jgi:hypothetical protein
MSLDHAKGNDMEVIPYCRPIVTWLALKDPLGCPSVTRQCELTD